MKSKLRNLLYVFSFSPAAIVVYGNLNGSYFTALNIVYSLVVLALIEWLTPPLTANEHSSKDDTIPKLILWLHVPVQLLCIGTLFYSINTGIIDGYWIITAALSTGLNSGSSAIVVSHELIHSNHTFEKWLGRVLLFTAGNMYFYIDHLRVHHKWVGTHKDHATARLGESVYGFFVRSSAGQLKGAVQLEADRLKKSGHASYGLRNYVIRQLVMHAIVVFALYSLVGYLAVLAFIIQCFFANFLLEYVNYIQHYGLTRKENQRATEEHSWDCDQFVSRFVLVDLARHADHHYYASKPYHTLLHYTNSPKLPTGYAGMFFIAAVPSWWRSIIHPRIPNQ
ncbi:MAG: alkane 1-monooxygenase [Bacteroidota bacterium]|jgi:alkane 1-monooxygenase